MKDYRFYYLGELAVYFVLSLGAVIAIFSGIMFFHSEISGTNNYLPTSTSYISKYHLIMTFFGLNNFSLSKFSKPIVFKIFILFTLNCIP